MQTVYRRVAAVLMLAGATWALIARPEPAAAGDVRAEATRRLMGVPWRIVVYADSGTVADAALAAAFAEVERLEHILSDYEPTSELTRLSARAPTAEPVAVGTDLWQVLKRAVAIREATDGSFDPAVGPLTALWRQARRSGRLPRADRLAAARAVVGREALAVAADRPEVSVPLPGTRLDLGGIGMGYAADRALAVLAERGIEAALIDASGDIVVSGAPPGAAGWRIGLPQVAAAPTVLVDLAGAAVATSGDARQAVEIDGVRYSHIVDPATGLGVTGQAAVTVIAPDGITADSLSTALCVLGPDRGLAVLTRFPGCTARFVCIGEGRFREIRAPHWPAPALQPPETPQSSDAPVRP